MLEHRCLPPACEQRDGCLGGFPVALMKCPEESDEKGWVHFGSGETASVVAGKHLASREGGEGAIVEAGGSCSHPSPPLPSGSRGEAGIKPQDLPHPTPVTYILHQGSITFKRQQKLHLSKAQDVKRDIRLHRGVLSPGQSSTPPTRAVSVLTHSPQCQCLSPT